MFRYSNHFEPLNSFMILHKNSKLHKEKKVTNHFELIIDNNLILKVNKKTLKASKFNTKKNNLHPNEIKIKTYLWIFKLNYTSDLFVLCIKQATKIICKSLILYQWFTMNSINGFFLLYQNSHVKNRKVTVIFVLLELFVTVSL